MTDDVKALSFSPNYDIFAVGGAHYGFFSNDGYLKLYSIFNSQIKQIFCDKTFKSRNQFKNYFMKT